MIKNYPECVPDFKDSDGRWVMSYCDEDFQYFTRACRVWHGVQGRSKLNGVVQTKYKSYQGTLNLFEGFQHFTDWCQQQYGYMLKESNGRWWCLDKDIIKGQQKIYSPETCLFVPNYINCLLVSQVNKNRKHPLGVSMTKTGKFRAQIRLENKNKKHLGVFETPEEAHKAYQKAKVSLMDRILLDSSLGSLILEAVEKYRDKMYNQLINGIESRPDWASEFSV